MHESQQDVLAARAFGMNALHAPQGACSAALAQLESLVGLQLTPTAEAPLSMVFRCGGRHGDGAIAVDGWGDGDNPESPIVFFHGGGQTRRSWDRNARPTQARVHAHKHTRTTKTLCDAVDSSGSCAVHACLRAACLYRCSRLAVSIDARSYAAAAFVQERSRHQPARKAGSIVMRFAFAAHCAQCNAPRVALSRCCTNVRVRVRCEQVHRASAEGRAASVSTG